MALSFGASAQSDGFFRSTDNENSGREGFGPGLPGEHGGTGDVSAPLGSGLLILTAMGAGYAIAIRKREE